MEAMCVVVTIGTAIQTAAVDIGMFLAGRVLAGYAVGYAMSRGHLLKLIALVLTNPTSRGMVATVPIYLSEISDPRYRGLIGGISGCGISFGTMMSNWVGYACSFAPYGPLQWRLPLGIQIPWGIIMFLGLVTFMPNSPRQLLQKGKTEEARSEFTKVRRDLHAHQVHEEFALMRAQIEYEREREIRSYVEIFKLFRQRVLVYVMAT